jgi:uncharacterized protein
LGAIDGDARMANKHYLLIYDVDPSFIRRRGEFRDEHLALAWKAAEAGHLLLAGALEEPTEHAFLLFQGPSPDQATHFAESDPYVRHGLVKRWRVRQWNTVVGEHSASPTKPTRQSVGEDPDEES